MQADVIVNYGDRASRRTFGRLVQVDGGWNAHGGIDHDVLAVWQCEIDGVVHSDAVHFPADAFHALLELAEKVQAPNRMALAAHEFQLEANPVYCIVRQAPGSGVHLSGGQVHTACGVRARRGIDAGPADAQDGDSLGECAPVLSAGPAAFEIALRIEHDEHV